jgi:hypothetical protein
MATANKFHVQRHDVPDVRLCSPPGNSDRSPHCWGWTRLCQNACQERPGPESVSCEIVAVLCHCVHKVWCVKLLLDYPITFHRTSCAEGIPPLAESFFDSDERDREDMIPYLPTDLQLLHKVYIILLRAIVAMGKTNLQSIKCDVRVLRSLINIFDSQLLSLAPSAPSDLGKYHSRCSRHTTDQHRHASTELCAHPCDGIPLLRPSYEP